MLPCVARGCSVWLCVVMATSSILQQAATRSLPPPSQVSQVGRDDPPGGQLEDRGPCVISCAQLPDGSYPACHQGCTHYVICRRHHLYHVTCPRGFAFYSASATCVSRDLIKCQDTEMHRRPENSKSPLWDAAASWSMPIKTKPLEGKIQSFSSAPLHGALHPLLLAAGGRIDPLWLHEHQNQVSSTEGTGRGVSETHVLFPGGMSSRHQVQTTTSSSVSEAGQEATSVTVPTEKLVLSNDVTPIRAVPETEISFLTSTHVPQVDQSGGQTSKLASPILKSAETETLEVKEELSGTDTNETVQQVSKSSSYLPKRTNELLPQMAVIPQVVVKSQQDSNAALPFFSKTTAAADGDSLGESPPASSKSAVDLFPFLRLSATLTNMVNLVVSSAMRSLNIKELPAGFVLPTTMTTPPSTTTPTTPATTPGIWKNSPLSGILDFFTEIINAVNSVLEALFPPKEEVDTEFLGRSW